MKGPPHVRLSLKKGILYHGEILHHLHTGGIASGVKFSHHYSNQPQFYMWPLNEGKIYMRPTFDLT